MKMVSRKVNLVVIQIRHYLAEESVVDDRDS